VQITFCITVELKTSTITSYVQLNVHAHRLDITTRIQNSGDNHRLRVLFPSDVQTDSVYADSVFDVCRRDIVPYKKWENPSNCQRMASFVSLHDDLYGLVVAGQGLYEYEILRDGHNTVALTLLRCVKELGDWGVFPTPDSQMYGEWKLKYSVLPFASEHTFEAYTQADEAVFSSLTAVAGTHQTNLFHYLEVSHPALRFSCFKKEDTSDDVEVRFYNMSDEFVTATIRLDKRFNQLELVQLDGSVMEAIPLVDCSASLTVGPKKIITLRLKQ
jgi:alpha-mannosidase